MTGYDAAPAQHLTEPEFADLTADEKLRHLQRLVRQTMGDDWNPVLRLAQLAEKLIEEGDTKTAITALNAVADRMHPRLKAHEITERQQNVIVVSDADPAAAAASAAPVPSTPRLVT